MPHNDRSEGIKAGSAVGGERPVMAEFADLPLGQRTWASDWRKRAVSGAPPFAAAKGVVHPKFRFPIRAGSEIRTTGLISQTDAARAFPRWRRTLASGRDLRAGVVRRNLF
jgi:hypothetical protein